MNKGFQGIFGGRISVIPRYNKLSNKKDVTVAFDSDSGETSIKVDASKSLQTITLSQQVAEGHRITPIVNSKGQVSVTWKKDLNRIGDSLTTTVGPGEIKCIWRDGAWIAQFHTSLDGYKTEGLTVKVNRKVTFI